MTDSERQLVDLYLDGFLPESEHALLFQRLETDPEALVYLASRTQLNVDLRRSFKRRKLQQMAVAGAATSMVRQRRSVWLSWRPLTAAAAGIMFGMFCTSVVFGHVKSVSPEVKHVAVPVFDGGFERADVPVQQGFPSAPQLWGADSAVRVKQDAGVLPKQGGAMLRLEPTERFYSRLVQVIDLDSLPPAVASSAREFKLSASFHSAQSGTVNRYKLRVFGFDEASNELKPFPLETEDPGIISATRVLDVSGSESGWQTVTAQMPLPPTVRSIVIWFGASVLGAGSERSAHYVDDVRATLLVNPGAVEATTP